MKALMKTWNPWQELNQIQQEMSQLFGRRTSAGNHVSVYPPVNLWSDEASLVLTAELPGIDPEKLDLTVNRNTITFSGTREFTQPQEGETYYRQERSADAFSRTLELPFEVDPQSADATYEKGVLTLRLARPASHQPQKVQVKAS
jgi:HSP20 family protein